MCILQYVCYIKKHCYNLVYKAKIQQTKQYPRVNTSKIEGQNNNFYGINNKSHIQTNKRHFFHILCDFESGIKKPRQHS